MKTAILILLLFCAGLVPAQDYGIQWVLGNNESVLDFRNDTITNYPIGPQMPMFLTEANICDLSGDLLYYTNGIYIAGKHGNLIANGDSLSPCDYTNQSSCCGLNIPQATLFLPKPGDTSRFYLLHFSNDTDNGNLPGNLYYTEIHDSSSGIVEKKNVVFGKGIFRQGGLTACKHANGRDWWVVMGLHNSNRYFTYLFTPDSIFGPFVQSIGPAYYGPFDLPYSKFSQDGSKYATACISGPILIMDFDRCTGDFSNPDTLFNETCLPPSSCNGATSLEFSTNGRLLYVTNTLVINQYDLSSDNPQQDSIAICVDSTSDVVKNDMLQLAPNGKLYATCYNGGYYIIHGVNYPDLKGDSCMYVDTAFTTLTANSANFPNMINYKLGPLYGSGCDTIYTATKSIASANQLRVLPNPANRSVYIEMGARGNYEFDLLNVVGQLVSKKETKQVDVFDTENLANGIYILQVVDKTTNAVRTQKLVVQH